jgi:hypothetical protein
VDFVQARCAMNRRGGTIPRAIKGHSIVALQKHHRFQRLAALKLPKDARERRP